MPSILNQNYHVDAATEFKGRLAWSETLDTLLANGGISAAAHTAVLAGANSVALYVFIGYPSPWTSESAPPTPEDTPQTTTYDYWRNMLGAKRVAAANTCHVVSRIDWTTGTIYTQYDDTIDLLGEEFYVLVLDGGTTYQVYKCLWNANGATSTQQPTGTDVAPQTYADGYVWKYLYTLPTVSDKFLTPSWMPVYANATIQSSAAGLPGSLPTAVPLLIVSGGARYVSTVNVTATLDGDGTGALVSNSGISVQGGTIASIVLTTAGLGYSDVASINVYQTGDISQATARAIIPPFPGHGFDPIHELHAKHLMCVVQFADDEGGTLTTNNNFRQVGLLVNPQLADGNLATNTFYKQTWDVTLQAGGSTWDPDDLVINTTKSPSPSGVVVDVLDLGGTIQQARFVNVNTRGLATPFAYNDVLKVGGSFPASVDANTVVGPELLPYSGHVLYVNQRIAVSRANGATQDIKIVLPFG